MINIKVIGAAAVAAAIRKAVNKREGKVALEVKKTAINVQRDAIKNAPVDKGRLRSSIGIEASGRDEYKVGTNVEYAEFQEFGTRNMAAQPFMQPAVESNRDDHRRRIARALK